MHILEFIFLFWHPTKIVLGNLQFQKLLVYLYNGPFCTTFFTFCLKLFISAPVSLRPLSPSPLCYDWPACGNLLVGWADLCVLFGYADPKQRSVNGLTTFIGRTVGKVLGGSRENLREPLESLTTDRESRFCFWAISSTYIELTF